MQLNSWHLCWSFEGGIMEERLGNKCLRYISQKEALFILSKIRKLFKEPQRDADSPNVRGWSDLKNVFKDWEKDLWLGNRQANFSEIIVANSMCELLVIWVMARDWRLWTVPSLQNTNLCFLEDPIESYLRLFQEFTARVKTASVSVRMDIVG